jgi:hypothetical protein
LNLKARSERFSSRSIADFAKPKVDTSLLIFAGPPLEFELSFEEGFNEARAGLEKPSTREEGEGLCARET